MITAIQEGTNASLIATAQTLYPMTGKVIDLTPGSRGGFWRVFQPRDLTCLPPGIDFRDTGLGAGEYDHVVFDPPYVTPGGRETSTINGMNERYGMHDTLRTPLEQWQEMIIPGLHEAKRLVGNSGWLWMKCMDFVSSGKVHWFTKMAPTELARAGWTLWDEFILAGHPGPQPQHNLDGTPRRQVHARRAHSSLMIARSTRRGPNAS